MSNRARIVGFVTIVGLVSGHAEPVRNQDLSAQSPWASHLDVTKLRGSPLGAFLEKARGFDCVEQLRQTVKESLSLDLRAIEGVTMFGCGEAGRETAVLMRGKFDRVDLASLAGSKEEAPHRGYRIHHGPQWHGAPLYLARRSDTELLGGTSARAVREGLDLLDGRLESWSAITLPDHARTELDAATTVLALDMERLAKDVQFEARFTRSLRRAWFLVGSRDEEIEFTMLIDSTDAEGIRLLRAQLEGFLVMLAAREEVPEEFRNTLKSVRVEVHDHWLTAKISAPPEKAPQLLGSLGTIFQEGASDPGTKTP